MVEKVGIGKREIVGHYGKALYGGILVQDANKIICLVPKRSMVAISDKDPSTMRDYVFLSL